MESFLSDWRKTALGAGALLIFAVLFGGSGGIGETAMIRAQDLANRKQDAIREGAEAHRSAWFAPDESSYEVRAEAPPPRAEPPPLPQDLVRLPDPVGADFPQGRRPRG